MPNSVHPGIFVKQHVLPSSLSVTAAAKLIGVGRPALSNLLNGNAALSIEMAAKIEKAFGVNAKKLLAMQAEFESAEQTTEETIASTGEYAPRYREIRASQLEQWAGTLRARSRMAVLLRILVQAAGARLSELDFPGNDDAERPGWDGRVVADRGSPWVPVGRSGWEFGTNQDPRTKADNDYTKSLKVTDGERAQTTFVFVTPRRWAAKGAWRDARLKDGYFKDVRAYDASDLEQWLEQSIVGQAWMAEELGLAIDGVHTLERLLHTWQADTRPQLPTALFDDILEMATRSILGKLIQEPEGRVVIRADSIEEANGLLAVMFNQRQTNAEAFRDRLLFFTSADAARRLLTPATRIIPIAADEAVEREIAISRAPRSIIIYPKGSMVQNIDLDVGLCEAGVFRNALENAGCHRDEVARLARESGLSRTVLRRRLTSATSISRPAWAHDPVTARILIPLMFLGSWNSAQTEDREIVRLLSGGASHDSIDTVVQRLVASPEPPVWSVSTYRGVGSRVDLLHALHEQMTRKDIEDFLVVAEMVLAEDDPALDLPDDQRWAANIHGKSRSISDALRQGIREAVLLLAVNGPDLFDHRIGMDLKFETEKLISRLLNPLDLRKLEAQSDELPFYAEAAPELFLRMIEDDLQNETPIIHGLLRPSGSGLFSDCPRTGLLWALEITAWSASTFRRTIDILATLSDIDIDDNWANKPFGSLAAILSSWMPQTTVPLEDRLWAYEHVMERHPKVGWQLCLQQFGMAGSVGHYSQKPRWRSEASGAGEPLKFVRDVMPSRVKALELMLNRQHYTKEMLNDLISHCEIVTKEHEKRIWALIEMWAQNADEADKAWVKEKIRTTVQLNKLRTSKRDDVRSLTCTSVDKILKTLAPSDLVLRHLWLFENPWVEDAADRLENPAMGYDERMKRTRAARKQALEEIWLKGGVNDVMRLCRHSKAPGVVGDTLFDVLPDGDVIPEILRTFINATDKLDAARRHEVASGLMWRMADANLQSFLRRLFQENGRDLWFELVLVAPFKAETWSVVDEQPEAARKRYWSEVTPKWLPDDQANADRAVTALLDVGRAVTSWFLAGWNANKLMPSTLVRILRAIATGEGEQLGDRKIEPYSLSEAFKAIHESRVLTPIELAQLEFAYSEAFEFQTYGLPGLHDHLRDHPGMLAELVSLIYRTEKQSGETPTEPSSKEKALAGRAYRLLHQLKRVPFAEDASADGRSRLVQWLRSAHAACVEVDRGRSGESQLGELLGRTENGKDGLWPNENVRDALEEIGSEQLLSAMVIGRLNARGAVYRRRGGIDDHDLAEQYRRWAASLQLRNPKASELCHRIANHYASEAKWHEQRDDIERRTRPW